MLKDIRVKVTEKDIIRVSIFLDSIKEDRIRPVITLVVHFGADEWDGPLSLYEMMDLEDKKLLEFVQDYRIFLIDPYKLANNDLEKFSTSLGDVLDILNILKIRKRCRSF